MMSFLRNWYDVVPTEMMPHSKLLYKHMRPNAARQSEKVGKNQDI